MYQKLIAGELSLGEAFWKFCIVGSLLGFFVVRMFGGILSSQLHGYSIYTFYTRYYNPLRNGSDVLLSTVCYLTFLAIFCWYIFSVILGVWRSSAEYESPILKYLARFVSMYLAYLYLGYLF